MQVERIKAESAQKDALIRQLQHEITQVKATRTQHQQLREQVRIHTHMGVRIREERSIT